MNEVDFYKSLSDYIDGCMKESQKKSFESVLSKDKNLKLKVDGVIDMIKDIKSQKSLSLPSDFNYKLKNKILEKSSGANSLKDFNVYKIFDNPLLATLGSIAAIFLVVLMTNLYLSKFTAQSVSENNQMDISSAEDEEDYYKKEDYNVLDELDIERVDFNLNYEDN